MVLVGPNHWMGIENFTILLHLHCSGHEKTPLRLLQFGKTEIFLQPHETCGMWAFFVNISKRSEGKTNPWNGEIFPSEKKQIKCKQMWMYIIIGYQHKSVLKCGISNSFT